MSDSSSTGIHVLHVDDEPDFAKLTTSFLEREDDRFTVETTATVDEALASIRESPPDCVVSDYNMPGQDGIEFLEAVREEYPDLPFILFTGKGSEEIASEAISAGVTEYLQKTANADQYTVLANRITNLVEKYRAEQAQKRNRVLIDEATDGILVVSEDATITFATPATESILGRAPAELLGTDGLAPIHPDDTDRVAATFRSLIDDPGGRRTVEFRYERPDESWIWVEAHGRNLLDAEAVDGVAVYVRDITDRKERIETLREEKALDEATVESAAEIYFTIDSGGYVTRWSDTDGDVTGYDEQAAKGRHFSEFYPEAEAAAVRETIDEIIETGSATLEADLLTKSGERVPYYFTASSLTDEEGSIESICGLGQDITDRKARERELREATERYRTLLDTAPDAIFVADAETGEILETNEAATELLGRPSEEIVGMHQAELHPPEKAEEYARLFERHQEDGSGRDASFEDQMDLYVVDADGEHIPVEISARVAEINGERLIQGYFRDITRRKQREQELKEKNERLEEFTSVVSHDLRNPLTVLQQSLGLVEETGDHAHLARCHRTVDRMEQLIDELLVLAREGDGIETTEPVSLGSVAKACWENVLTEEATLVIEDDCVIRADQNRLKQLLENLLGNAVEHGGGNVTVSIGTLSDGFYVADSGPGIDPESREKIFDAGYSQSPDGTGFGLSIVERVADSHGWAVQVTESTDGGARFEVRGVDPVSE